MTDIVEFHVAGIVRIDIAALVAKGVKAIEVHSLGSRAVEITGIVNTEPTTVSLADTRTTAAISEIARKGLARALKRRA